MRQAKYNETARLAKEGKLPPKPKPKKLTQVEFYEKLMGLRCSSINGTFWPTRPKLLKGNIK